MKTKFSLLAMLLIAISIVMPAKLMAADKSAKQTAQPAPNMPDSPLKAIGVILINAEDPSEVILLTKVATKDAPNGKMVGIPIELDDMGKKIVAEYGINGIKPGEKNGMERIQNESQKKAVFVEGTLKLSSGKGKLAIKNYGSAKEIQDHVKPKQTNTTKTK